MIGEPSNFQDWLGEDGLYWLCEDALTHEFTLSKARICLSHKDKYVTWPYDTRDGRYIFKAVWDTLIAARNEAEKYLLAAAARDKQINA